MTSSEVYKSDQPLIRPRIGLLEDSDPEASALQEVLSANGFDVVRQSSGTKMLEMLRQESFDALILDWNLPDISGFEVLRRIRSSASSANLPTLMLTAQTGEFETVQALEGGANDYITKPWRSFELVARIRVLLRPQRPSPDQLAAYLHGYSFDSSRHLVCFREHEVSLSSKEFNVALILFRHMDRPVSRAQLMQSVWHGQVSTGRTIDTHVSRVRTKLDLTAESGFTLHSIHGIGYRLNRLSDRALAGHVHSTE